MYLFFFFSSRRRHTRCALVTGVQTCALPISDDARQFRPHPAAAQPHRLNRKSNGETRVNAVLSFTPTSADRQERGTLIAVHCSGSSEIGRASCREIGCQYV